MSAEHLIQDDAPVYVAVKRALRQRLGSQWRVGDRLPPVADLARDLGVGQNNAHRAVRDLVAEGVLLSRRRLGTFVRRLPRETGDTATLERSLQGVRLALAFYGASPPPFIHQMMDGFRTVVHEAGAQTQMVSMEPRGTALPEFPGVWGAVLFNPSSNLAAPPGKMNLAVVSTGDHLHFTLLSRFDSVLVDQYQAGALAGQALRECGCEQVCFMGRRVALKQHRFDITSAARLHGLEMGLGHVLEQRHLIDVPGYSVLSGGKYFRHYLSMQPRPVGVFCASDELALGFVSAAASHGLTAGRDFHIVGFDGQRGEDHAPGARLTSVRVPAAMMGRRAAELMILRAADPTRPVQRVLLPCAMSWGDTTSFARSER